MPGTTKFRLLLPFMILLTFSACLTLERYDDSDKTGDGCCPEDFIHLKNTNLQNDFFAKLDSTRKGTNARYAQDSALFIDLTPDLLNLFLNDINKETLAEKNEFEKAYYFNAAPSHYKDSTLCADKIILVYNPGTDRFRMSIYNSFYADTACHEALVTYLFRIESNRITHFHRNVAG